MDTVEANLLDTFIQESKEHLEILEPCLLSLESEPGEPETINKIFRAVHSIKGSSGFFALNKISTLSHVMESMMSLVRDGKLKVTKPMIDALLDGTDKLKIMIDDLKNSENVDVSSNIAVIQNLMAVKEATVPQVEKDHIQTPATLEGFHLDRYLIQHAVDNNHCIYSVELYTHKDIKDRGRAPMDLFREIEKLGEFIDSHTDFSSITGLDGVFNHDPICKFLFSTPMEWDLLKLAFDVPDEQIKEVPKSSVLLWLASQAPIVETKKKNGSKKAVASLKPSLEQKEGPVSQPIVKKDETPVGSDLLPEDNAVSLKKTTKRHDDTIRVSVSILDDLMNLAGEMVLGRNQLLRLSNKTSSLIEDLVHMTNGQSEGRGDANDEGKHLADRVVKENSGMASALQNISIITTELQEKVMLTRLQPVGSIFGKFPRIIRDLSAKLGKEVDLEVSGEDVELDKSIIETLSDPLTHLIRNCVDHAIELPLERERVGKSRIGKVKLSASHVGGQVYIEVTDDGKGMNVGKIKEKALEKEITNARELESMSRSQILNIVFLPGFSTAEQVTEVSGRGVGMDVVKTNIEGLGGTIELDSIEGKGTRVCLKLPLTLAIIPAMIVGVGERRFAVPQVNLEEIVELSENHKIELVRGSRVMRLRDQLLPLVHLGEILKVSTKKETSTDASKQTITSGDLSRYVLVLKVDNNPYGLLVDSLFDSEEIVVKPLSLYLKDTHCYSGETIMGDGKVAMILDAGGVAEKGALNFTDFSKKDAVDSMTVGAVSDASQKSSESQSLLLFRNEGSELFAINLGMVSRIEEIRTADIDKIGDKEFLNYGKSSLRLIRLHDFLPVKKPTSDPETLNVIVPKLVSKPIGIVATKVEDAIESSVALDEGTIHGNGILGSAVINKKMVVFIDVYNLFGIADPESYKWLNTRSKFSDYHVLLAEDTPFFRTIERQYLGEIFPNLDVVCNGLEAWEKLNKHKYDLLITDIEMPLLNGIELVQRIRASEDLQDLPVVALTALSSEQHVERGKAAGVDAYEAKLDKERLRKTIERVLIEKQHSQLAITSESV